MALSRSLGAYHDVAQVLATARKHGGARYELESPNKAIRWRQRAYTYRALLARADEEAHAMVPGYLPMTPWDDMSLTLDGPVVVVEFSALAGKLTNASGEAIDPLAPSHKTMAKETTDAALLAALQLVETKGTDE